MSTAKKLAGLQTVKLQRPSLPAKDSLTMYNTDNHAKHARICAKTLYKGIKTMIFFRLILGIFMLTAGSRLFWLFLGAVGFISSFELAEKVMQSQPSDIIIIVALLAGLVGALLAVFLQKIAILAGGFLAGGYLSLRLMGEFGMRSNPYYWLLLILGCIIGAVLMRALFKWTLIILSSGMGAILILQVFPVSRQTTRLPFVILLILGIAIQAGLFSRKSSLRN